MYNQSWSSCITQDQEGWNSRTCLLLHIHVLPWTCCWLWRRTAPGWQGPFRVMSCFVWWGTRGSLPHGISFLKCISVWTSKLLYFCLVVTEGKRRTCTRMCGHQRKAPGKHPQPPVPLARPAACPASPSGAARTPFTVNLSGVLYQVQTLNGATRRYRGAGRSRRSGRSPEADRGPPPPAPRQPQPKPGPARRSHA